MSRDLATRLQMLFDKFKLFPEARWTPEGLFMKSEAATAFLDARQMIEREVIPALSGLPPVAPPWRPIDSFFRQEPETPDVLVDAGSGLGFWDEDDRTWRDATTDEPIEPGRWMPLPER